VDANGTMYGVDSGGMAVAIDKTGKLLWSVTVGPAGAATSVAKVGRQLYIVANDGMLHQLSADTGAPGWAAPVGNQPEIFKHGGPVVDGNQRLYFNSNDGNLYCFDLQGHQLWKQAHSGMSTPNGNSFAEMAIGNDGTLYVPGNDGYLYVFH
jgi:outer membrane protein assembly factor BamB